MLASDLVGRLDKGDGDMEVLTYPFLRLAGGGGREKENQERRIQGRSRE